ncbi:hypothetical protein GGI12_002833 [Dipsacomyces acuminosporus]|nr:hypothetical protein GGI12_002833 [Dipsacomyces acuminosporus]
MLCRFEAHVVRALAKREGSSIAPKAIVARLKLVAKQMRIGRQEDAHEFLRLLVDSFQRSLLHGMDPKIDRRIQETSLVHQIFGGYLQSQVTCSKCDHDSNTFDPLLDISLDIQSGSNIAKALRSFTRPEHLVKGNRYKCEKCSKLVDATKQMTVYRLPRILTLQLKRFSIFGGGKINRYVEFPLHLSMKGYTSSNSSSPGIFSYSLYAVLVHAGGTSRSGHYYCFVKSPAGVWYELNDSMVHQVSERTVLKQSAYLLFYERCSAKHCEQASAAATKAKTEPVQHQQNSAKKPSDRHTESAISAASEEMETMLGRLDSRPSSNNPSKVEKQKKKKKKSKSKLVKHHDLSSEPAASATDSASTPERSTRPALGIKGASDEINKLASQLHPKHSLEQTTGSPHKNQAAIAAAAVEKIGASLSDSAKSKDDKKNATNDPASSEWVVRKKVSSAVNGKAQVIGWNEDTASKRAKATSLAESRAKNSWDIAEVRANRKSQYGASVQSWAGTGSAADQLNESLNAPRKRQRRPDSWDTEYDRGRLKKVKKHRHNKFASTINPFQLLGERQGNKR